MLLEEIIPQIEKLLDMKVGDDSRLTSILEQLKNGKDLYSSDQKYIDNLISKFLFPSGKKTINNNSDNALQILKNRLANGEISLKEFEEIKEKLLEVNSDDIVHQEIKDVNEQVKKIIEEQNTNQIVQSNMKSVGVTLVLSILLGFVGLQGMGHFYVRKFGLGIVFLVIPISILIAGLLIGEIQVSQGLVFLSLGVYLVIYIAQIISAYNLCKKYNEYVITNKKRPW